MAAKKNSTKEQVALKQNQQTQQNRVIETENKQVVARGEERNGCGRLGGINFQLQSK